MNTEKLLNTEFIHHTTNWLKGEILESIITSCIGLIILIGSLLFWKYGNTPYARALIIPLFVVGIIPFIMGISGAISNYRKIPVYEQQWQQDNKSFIKNEKERVEGFDNIFKYTYPMAIILVIGGAILFFLVYSPTFKAISLTMMLLGLMTYFIDHFAAERAEIYYQYVQKEINKPIPDTQ